MDNIVDTINSNDLIFIGGRPATGKTNFGLKFALEMIKKTNKLALILCLDISEDSMLSRLKTFTKNKTLIDKCRLVGYKENNSITSIIENFKEVKDLGVIVIDYIQLIKTDDLDNKSNYILEKLKALANEINTPIVALSQLSRDVSNVKPTIEYLETKDIDCNNLDKIIFLCEDKTFYEAK